MKKLRLLALLVAATLPFAACSDHGTQPGGQTGSLQGTVVVEGTPLASVTVAISGPQSASTTTDANGHYAFQNVPTGTYTIEISGLPNDVTFAATSKTGNVAAGTSQSVDFSGDYIRTAVISGKVVANSSDSQANVSGITVTLSGTESRTTQTDASGAFVFDGLRAGSYTVTIDASGLSIQFDQTSQQVQVSVGQTANVTFTGVVPQAAQITINTITGPAGANVNTQNIAGIIYVNLNVDPGNETVSRVSVSLNGTEAWSQDMSLSTASSGASAVGSYPVQAEINTASFDPNTLAVDYPNGGYQLTADLETAEGSTATATQGKDLKFNNPNVVRVVHVSGSSAVAGGVRWYGHDDQVFRADAIIYSQSLQVSKIGVTATSPAGPSANSGNPALDLGAGPGNEMLITGPAPFTFTASQANNSPASPGTAGGYEDTPGNNSVITITSVNDQDGVDQIAAINALGTNTPFAAPMDFVAPVVNAAAVESQITVAGVTGNASGPPAVIDAEAGAPVPAAGAFFSSGSFGLSNSSELGVGGSGATFAVDDNSTSAKPDFTGVSGFSGVAERNATLYNVMLTKFCDMLQNCADLSANPVEAISGAAANTAQGVGVDKGAPNVTAVLPAPGASPPLILNPDNGATHVTPANFDGTFTIADPNLADGNPGSGVAAFTLTAAKGAGAAVNVVTTAPYAGAGAYTFDLDETGANAAAFPSDGGYTITLTQPDQSLPANKTKVTWNVILDGTAPATTMLNPPSATVTSSNANLTFTIQGSATDANGLSKVLVNVREDVANNGCDLGDPLVTNTGAGATGNMTNASYNVTASASSISQQVTLSNPGGGGVIQHVCFFIESSDNATDVNGNAAPNVSNQSARTDITWN